MDAGARLKQMLKSGFGVPVLILVMLMTTVLPIPPFALGRFVFV